MLDSGYPILFEGANFKQLNHLLQQNNYSKVLVLVDENTAQHCLPFIQKNIAFELHVIKIKAGEEYKNISTCQLIWQAMINLHADRKTVLLNLGGGVIGDMGGFCASTYKRGIDFIQIPTTLLAQVDASVGGKLGIDFALVKNGIGLFQNPTAVFLHIPFFKTLPYEQLQSGYAEVLKHALINDKEQWQVSRQINDLEKVDWKKIVQESLPIKQKIVSEDPYEKDIRKSLNFGHTIGHVLESLSWETSKPLLHGHAVAIGLVAEAFLSYKLLAFSLDECEQIKDYIHQIYSVYDCTAFNNKEIAKLLLQDKKNEKGCINCTLLSSIGTAKINIPISVEDVILALDYYNTREL